MKKIEEELPGVQKNIVLADYTTYKIGGPAKYFFIAETKDGLIKAVTTARKFKIPVFILGGGSNLLISEKGFKGLVIKIQNTESRIQNTEIYVGSGANLTKLAYSLADNGFSGLEWAAGVPGTVGGAVYGNAQAFGGRISDAVKEVEVVDSETFEVKIFSKEQCQFSLKNSIFKQNKNLAIISAVLELERADIEKIKSKISEFINYRREKHPMGFPSAGSVFINPEAKIVGRKLLEKFPELNEYNKKGIIPAGYLIEKSGLSGKKKGNAQISEKHANFIINLGNAKAKDVLALIKLARKQVKKVFGIELEPEVQIVGFK